MDMVQVVGKKNRKVPLLLTVTASSAVQVLINKRAEVGIDHTNPYVFAVVS